MTKQPAENMNANADEEQAAKHRVIPEPLFTADDEAEALRVAQDLNVKAVGPDELNQARDVVRARKLATRHA